MATRVLLSLIILGVATIANAMQPRAWNSEYAVWQRGESFTNSGSGRPTADQSRNGPCIGATININKETLAAATRAALAASPLIKAAPRFAKRVTWVTAPTAGEGRTGGSVNYCAGGTEDWVDLVAPSAGQTITVMACAWTTSGTRGFYLYASQWTGQGGDSGSTGSYFIGTEPGIDNSNFHQEVLHRSGKMTMTVVSQCFSYTFDLFSVATIAPDNGLIIGVGFDYQDLAAGTEIHLTAVDFQFGAGISEPWEPTPDSVARQLSQLRFQVWGMGLVGFTINSTSILVSLPYNGMFNPPQPLQVWDSPSQSYPPPSIAALTLQNSTPRFQISGIHAYTAENAKIIQIGFGPSGDYAVIDGFTDLPVGEPAMFGGVPGPLIHAEWW